MRSPLAKLASFLIIGLLNNGVGFLLYLLLTHQGITPLGAMTMVWIVGFFFTFVANRKITFSFQGNSLNAALRYGACYLLGYVVNILTLQFFSAKLGYPHEIVQGFSIVLVAGLMFISLKYFVFGNTRD